MRLVSFFLLGFALHVSASGISQKVSFTGKDIPVKAVFSAIKEQSGFVFFYDAAILQNATPVTVNLKDVNVEELVAACLKQQSEAFDYSIRNKTIFITRKQLTQNYLPLPAAGYVSDEIKIHGRILSLEGAPLSGASVRIKDAPRGTYTDKEGWFSMTVQPGFVLIISFVGFETQEIKITSDKQKNLEVSLQYTKNTSLGEVVIATGYQQIEQKYNTGAVTTLKVEDIKNPGINTLDKLLEGHVPGLTYIQNSGQVGVVPRLRIRGTSTILGNQEPIWVLDGIVLRDPVNVSAKDVNDLDFVNRLGNSISGLNPDDIDQIDILKDAASTALYGARAANGVIVITTKKGKPGPPSFTYSTNLSLSRRPRYSDRAVNMMNSKERVDVSREMFDRGIVYANQTTFSGYEKAVQDYNSGLITYEEFNRLTAYYETMNTDWFSMVGQDALSNTHTLSLSGGNSATRYYASLGYMNENGTIKKEYNKRFSTSININTTYKRFTIQFGLQANVSRRQYNPTDIGVMNYAYNTTRALPAYNANGSLAYYPVATGSQRNYNYNIVNEMNNSGDGTKGNTITFTSHVDYKVTDDLKIAGTLSYTNSNTNEEITHTANTFYIANLQGYVNAQTNMAPVGGEWQSNQTTQSGYTARLQADYNKRFGFSQKHLIYTSLGTEISSSKYDGFNITRRGYLPERGEVFAVVPLTWTGYYNLFVNSAAGQGVINRQLTNIGSLYYTATYNYDSRYTLNFNVRADKSNQFGKSNNNSLLPVYAVSARWDIKNDLLRKTKWINVLAIAPSFGYQGNMLDNQSSNLIIQKQGTNPLFNEYYSTIVNYPNPNLSWEKTASTNISADFSLFNNKIGGTISYFYKKTTNAFLTKTISDVNGMTNYVVNSGDLTNNGIEIALNFMPINKGMSGGKRGFTWRVDPQLGQVVNQLITKAIGNNNNALYSNTITYADMLSGAVPIQGKPLGTFYSYKFKKLDATDGSPSFYGAELDNSTNLSALYSKMNASDVYLSVMAPSGTRIPLIQGGLGNSFGYRNFNLSINLTYSLGNKVRLLKMASGYARNLVTPQSNLRKEYVNRWRQPGDENFTNVPGLALNNDKWLFWKSTPYDFGNSIYDMYDNSDIRVVSGNYVKVQSVSFRYTFDDKFCKKLSVKGAYVGLNGANLYTFANKELKGQDPAQSGSSPTINPALYPIFTMNLSVNF